MRAIRRTLAAAILVLAPSVALAGEMDVTWETLPAGSRGGVTMLDVVVGTLPAIEVRGPEGERYRLSLEITPKGNDIVTIEACIERVRVRRSGRVVYKEIARPLVSTTDGQSAGITFSPKGDLTFDLVFKPRLADSLNRPPLVDRDAAEAASVTED